MARPENLWLSPASLAKVDDDNYRAFIIDKAHLPFPENQSGSKRLIADTMMSVGIEVDPADITYAPAPGDTRSGFVTVVIVAKVTDGAAAMTLLDHAAARADLAFAQTHGGNTRERSKSNQNRWGDGYSEVAKRTALVCTRLRKLIKAVYHNRLDDADSLRVALSADGIDVGDVHREAAVVVTEAKAALKAERKLLHGRKRKQYILQGGGVCGT